MRRWRTSKKIQEFGQWAVTTYGIESLPGEAPYHYHINKNRLHEPYCLDHMLAKTWVNNEDFRNAYAFAVEHFGITVQEQKTGAYV